MDIDLERASEIAKLNDRFREMCLNFVYTRGVMGSIKDLRGLSIAVETHNSFSEDNDPWHEHDFGSLTFEGKQIFWKIDYYDEAMQHWCDPLSPACQRLLTVMLTEEY